MTTVEGAIILSTLERRTKTAETKEGDCSSCWTTLPKVPVFQVGRESGREWHLTSADSDAAIARGSIVAVEALVGVADVPLCAQLTKLLGTHPAAATGIQHQTHARGTLGGHVRAAACATALLGNTLGNTHTHTYKHCLVKKAHQSKAFTMLSHKYRLHMYHSSFKHMSIIYLSGCPVSCQ